MPRPVEAPISPEQLNRASINYMDCLNLHPSSQVLIITDKLPKSPGVDPHLETRRNLSAILKKEIGKDHQVAMIEFDENQPSEELQNNTERALNELNELGKTDNTVVIFLGAQWKERTGIYAGANEFGKSRGVDIKMAISLGFSTGDCRVMSELDKDKIKKISKINDIFETFFNEHPKGKFEVTTKDEDGEKYNLDLDYDVSKAPFRSDLGVFDGKHESPVSEFKNVKGMNIPGGEIYGIPYPYKSTNGKFSAEGLVFTVNNGLVVSVEFKGNKKMEDFEPSQQELIRLVNEEKQAMPFGELGIGFYKLLNIRTWKDSSILSGEKNGPHAGLGHGEESTKEEEEEVSQKAGNFRHTDFILDDPGITLLDPQGNLPFYPPFEMVS